MTQPMTFAAAGSLRDAFLDALDAGRDADAVALAQYLTGCTTPLPSVTCAERGLPPGSTYAAAARDVTRRMSGAQ
jgi:hypothetical protein